MNSVKFVNETEDIHDKTLKNKGGDIFADKHGRVAMLVYGVDNRYWLTTLHDGYVCMTGFNEDDTIDKVQEEYGFTYVGACNITAEKK